MRWSNYVLVAFLAAVGCQSSDSGHPTPSTPVSAAKAVTAPVAAGVIPVTPANTSIQFTGATALTSHSGNFAAFEGTLEMPGNDPKNARIHVVVDMDSTTTTIRPLTKHLKGEDFFDVARFPKAEFVSESITPNGPSGAYQVAGRLTLHGVQKPISFPAHILATGDEVVFEATITLHQSAFGMTEAARKTKDEVPVTVALHGRRS